jgi:hypothetical protein
MGKIPNSSRRLDEHISRAMNKIKNRAQRRKSPNCSIVTWNLKTGPFKQEKSQSGCGTSGTQR